MFHLVVFAPSEQVALLGNAGNKRDRRNTTQFVCNQEHSGVPRMDRKGEHAMPDGGDFSIFTIQRSEIFQEFNRAAQRIRVRHFDPAEALKSRYAGIYQFEEEFGTIESLDFGQVLGAPAQLISL